MRVELLERASELRAARMAFVVATVVRVAKPASAHAGDSAILLHITPPPAVSVAQAGPGAAELGMPGPPGPRAAAESADSDNEVTVGNPCLSGGALDIFLEVMRPPALVHLYGDTPVARALVAVGGATGLDVRPTVDAGVTIPEDATAVVVASQGGDEHRVLKAALDAGVPYVGLLASRRRGSALI
jgi:xanthine dehydrogenase accessory factor